jgi:preflagellin peptidase FlaK
MSFLDYVRPLLALSMLGYASYRDIRTREVNDLVWIVFGASALIIDAYEIYMGSLAILDLALSLLFVALFAILSGYLGFFGGADLFAFIVLGLLQPVAPRLGLPYLGFTPLFFPWTLISNAILVSASASVIVLVSNLLTAGNRGPLFSGHESEPAWRKFVLLISARRLGMDAVVGPPYHYPLEYIDADTGRLGLRLRPDLFDDDEAIKIFQGLRAAGYSTVWISSTLPFLLFLALGYVASIVFGDIALFMVSRIFMG